MEANGEVVDWTIEITSIKTHAPVFIRTLLLLEHRDWFVTQEQFKISLKSNFLSLFHVLINIIKLVC